VCRSAPGASRALRFAIDGRTAAAPQPPAAEFALPSSSEIEGPFSDSSSASSSDYGFSTSSAQPTSSSSSSDGAGFLPRRFGPIFFPAGPVQPLFFPGQQPQDDPFAAARTAFLNGAAQCSGAARRRCAWAAHG